MSSSGRTPSPSTGTGTGRRPAARAAGGRRARRLAARLRTALAAVDGVAVLDQGPDPAALDKDVDWRLRLSPHYYNTEEEIDEAATAVAELATGPR